MRTIRQQRLALVMLAAVGLVVVLVATVADHTDVTPTDRAADNAAPVTSTPPNPAHRAPGSTTEARAAPTMPGPEAVRDAAGDEPGAMAPLKIPSGWTSAVHRFSIGGLTRSYLTVRPAHKSDTVLPVVFVLHGRGATPALIERVTDLAMVTGPAILVFPAGYGLSWNAGEWCGAAHWANIDDLAFLSAVVHRVVRSQPDATTADVYLVGFSNGARMAYRMACQLPGAWAGVGAVEAVPASPCSLTTPTPIVIVANPRDPFFSLDGGKPVVIQGYSEPTVKSVVDEWRRLDGCSDDLDVRRIGIVTAEAWDTCRGNGEVTYALYDEPGHFWPTELTSTPGASQLVWSLLRYDRIPTVEGSPARAH